MNKQLFDEWQKKLFRFVFENKRKFTELEWRWMRYQFEIEHTSQQDKAPLALADDGDILPKRTFFPSWGQTLVLTANITPMYASYSRKQFSISDKDRDTVRSRFQNLKQYSKKIFTGNSGEHTYTISIALKNIKEKLIVYIKAVDEKNNAVSNLKIKLCKAVIELDEKGRSQMRFEAYKKEILKSLGLEFSIDGTSFYKLTPEN